MRVKKIRCLNCNTELVSDFDEKNYCTFVECSCENKTSLMNHFTLSQPGSIVRAINKSLVEAQALQDYDFCKKDEWWNLGSLDDTKYTKWLGRTEEGGFTGGLIIKFNSEPMTFNECRTHLKTNVIMSEEGRIFHLIKEIE